MSLKYLSRKKNVDIKNRHLLRTVFISVKTLTKTNVLFKLFKFKKSVALLFKFESSGLICNEIPVWEDRPSFNILIQQYSQSYCLVFHPIDNDRDRFVWSLTSTVNIIKWPFGIIQPRQGTTASAVRREYDGSPRLSLQWKAHWMSSSHRRLVTAERLQTVRIPRVIANCR